MLPRPGRRRGPIAAGVCLALVLVLAAAACSSGGPADDANDVIDPTLTVTPATDLVDGQEVRLQGSGWAPDARFGLASCQVGTSRCAVDEVEVETDGDGGLDIETTAAAAFVAWAGDPVDCRLVACELRIDAGDGTVTAALAFDPDPDADLGPQPAITVRPSGGLVDDQAVEVFAEHLDPGAHVGFALCAAGARSSFDDPCFPYDAGLLEEEQPGLGWTVSGDGVVAAELRVYADAYAYDRRVDCRVEQCEVVVTRLGAVLARAPVAVERGAPLRGPARIAVSPASGLAVGDRVEVRGSGFYAGEAVVVEQCEATAPAGSCVGAPAQRWVADDAGRFAGTFLIRRDAATDHQPVDCREAACVLRADRDDRVPAASRSVTASIRLDG